MVVVQGVCKEEINFEVCFVVIIVLGDFFEFVGNNFKYEGECNYIMQVVCEVIQVEDFWIQQGVYGCLNCIMVFYYENMWFYMEKVLFGFIILGMKSDDEDVVKLVVEFWSIVCEEEIVIEDDNVQVESFEQMCLFYNFSCVVINEVVFVFFVFFIKQDEDVLDDEYNILCVVYQCLQFYVQLVGVVIVFLVIVFVEVNFCYDDWYYCDVVVFVFGVIMDGLEEKILEGIVKLGMGFFIVMMDDFFIYVRDLIVYVFGCIIEICVDVIDFIQYLDVLICLFFNGFMNIFKMVVFCCWVLMNIVERFFGDGEFV